MKSNNVESYKKYAQKSILPSTERRFYAAAVLILAEPQFARNPYTGKQEAVLRAGLHIDMNDERIFHLPPDQRQQLAIEVGRAHAVNRGLALTGEVEYYNLPG